jgi:osmotically-inducible protein OsmY
MAVGTRTDEEIREMVADEFYRDGRVDPADIRVEVRKLRVTLTGTVPTHAALGAAEEDARAVVGVENVDCRLVVRQPGRALIAADQERTSRPQTDKNE